MVLRVFSCAYGYLISLLFMQIVTHPLPHPPTPTTLYWIDFHLTSELFFIYSAQNFFYRHILQIVFQSVTCL